MTESPRVATADVGRPLFRGTSFEVSPGVVRPLFRGASFDALPIKGYGGGQFTSETSLDTEPCSSFFRCVLKQKDLEYMETLWLPGIHDEIRNWKGFRHRLVISPPSKPDRHVNEDLEIVRAYWVDAARDRHIYVGSVEDHSGILTGDIEDTSNNSNITDLSKKLRGTPTRIELHESMATAPLAMPPPKYKLFFVIWMCVYFSNLINYFASGKRRLMSDGLSFGAATFIELCHMMTVIIYALAPFLMSLHIVEKWIKSPRCPVEQMHPVYRLFDQGLEIFAAPPKEKPPQEIMNRLDRLEGKVDRLKRVNHDLLELINSRSDRLESAVRETCENFDAFSRSPKHNNNVSTDVETTALLQYERHLTPPEVYHTSPVDISTVGPFHNEMSFKSRKRKEELSQKSDRSRIDDTSFKSTSSNEGKDKNGNVINIVDPALLKMEQYELENNLSEKSNMSERMKRALFSKEKTNVRMGALDDELEIDIVSDGAFDSGASPQVRSETSLFDLENQTEARSYGHGGSGDQKALTMVVNHLVKWERTLEFENWINRMFAEMSKFHGFIGQNTTPPLHEGDPYVNAFTFESYQDLHDFLSSKERRKLMAELLPLLEATSVAQISEERIIHDAFSELFVATGGSALGRPPSLWKITILTVVPLQLIVWSISGSLTPIMLGININIALLLFITTFTTVLVNIYIGLPLMHLFFGNWLRVPRGAQDKMEVWVAMLDVGLKRWQRVLLICLYYGFSLAFGFYYFRAEVNITS